MAEARQGRGSRVGISRASDSVCAGGISRSSAPTSTSVGAVIAARSQATGLREDAGAALPLLGRAARAVEDIDHFGMGRDVRGRKEIGRDLRRRAAAGPRATRRAGKHVSG